MTRFARAKGSKASNERAPEDGTPWEVMKEQLLQAKTDGEEAKKRKEAEQQRIENYEKFLREQKVQKRKATWCEFPEAESKKLKHTQPLEASQKKSKNKPGIEAADNTSSISESKGNNKNKKKNPKLTQQPQVSINSSQDPEPVQADEIDNSEISGKKKKIKNKQKKVIEPNENISDKSEPLGTSLKKKNKFKKNKKLNISIEENALSSQDSNMSNIKNINNNNIQNKKKKDKKFVNGVPVRRKAINDNSFQLIINGKEVELVRYDGFPIMKKDAERLKELKANMINKGIPKSEVNRTLKLERRRAEKALARLKRDVCYNCRKGGHNLSDCPELKSKIPGVGGSDGLCFKCGSTEHKQFECKVQKDKEFRFATCFICKEPGHIARQCPDNPKGLYPNGGSCKLCGDVTHLRKDCPTANDKKEETSIKLQTLDSAENLEGIEQTVNKSASQEALKKPKKIKF